MKAKTVDLGSGPPCYKIHGQVYHTFNLALHPDANEKPSYAQLFIVDAAEATRERMLFPANADCDEQLMRDLDKILRQVNPYYKAFLMMKEVEDDQNRLAMQQCKETPQLKLMFDVRPGADLRRYNMPTSNQVAAVFVVNDNDELPEHDGIMVHQRGKKLKQILKFDRRCESMMYPLYFPTGKGGWHLAMRSQRGKRVTLAQYYRYLLARRPEVLLWGKRSKRYFNPIHYGGKLYQQYLVDTYVRVEQNNLDYIRTHQEELKVESYKGLMDYLKENDTENAQNIGKVCVLPSTFVGAQDRISSATRMLWN